MYCGRLAFFGWVGEEKVEQGDKDAGNDEGVVHAGDLVVEGLVKASQQQGAAKGLKQQHEGEKGEQSRGQ